VKKVLQNINGKFLFGLRIVHHASSRAFSAASLIFSKFSS
jgi:hypothetical protein